MIKKKKFSLENFKSKLNNFKTKKAPFFEIEQYILSYTNKHPAEKINIGGTVFSELKDAYTKEVLSYGEEFVKANPKNDRYKNVLADRYKKLGNIKRYNELLGIKELSLEEFKAKLAYFKSKKVAFTEIKQYVDNQIEIHLDHKALICGSVFSVLKDAYTKDVLSYGEEYIKAYPKNDRYKAVLADRYKKVCNLKRSDELLAGKENKENKEINLLKSQIDQIKSDLSNLNEIKQQVIESTKEIVEAHSSKIESKIEKINNNKYDADSLIELSRNIMWETFHIEGEGEYDLSCIIENASDENGKASIFILDFGPNKLKETYIAQNKLFISKKYGYFRYLPSSKGQNLYQSKIIVPKGLNSIKIGFTLHDNISKIFVSKPVVTKSVINKELIQHNSNLNFRLLDSKPKYEYYDVKENKSYHISLIVENKVKENDKSSIIIVDFNGAKLDEELLKINKLGISKKYGYFQYLPSDIGINMYSTHVSIPKGCSRVGLSVVLFDNLSDILVSKVWVSESENPNLIKHKYDQFIKTQMNIAKDQANSQFGMLGFDVLKKLANSIPNSNGSYYYEKIGFNIAIISDIYMYNFYKDAFKNVYYLSPDNYKDVLDSNHIDAVIYVTGWKGINNEEWRGVKFREKPMKALDDILRIGRERSCKLIFQTIEDPSNFEYFLPVAKKFDYIFTSDTDMIENYKSELGHNNVFYGEYGFNPELNNPIGSQRTIIDGCFFAGSYTKRYEERCRDIEILFDSILNTTKSLVVADRNINIDSEDLKYPSKYRPYLIEPIDHETLQKVHKVFRFNLNLNSIKHSPTMCAMRVYELQAQCTNMISNYSKSLLNKFPNIRVIPERENFSFDYSQNDLFEYEKKTDSLRMVMNNKTSYDICGKMFNLVGFDYEITKPKICILAKKEDIEAVQDMVDAQLYNNVELLPTTKFKTKKDWSKYFDDNNIKLFTYFNVENSYEENYLNDLVNGFKYTDSSFITKNSYFTEIEYVKNKEHEYTNYIESIDKALFRTDKFKPTDFKNYNYSHKVENLGNGYSIDPFELNYTRHIAYKNELNKTSEYKLTVIVPVYNNGKHLKYLCIASLMRNKMWNDMEVLLIDDGSSDIETINICKKLEMQYPNISCYFYNDGGSGSASRPRNKGMDIAKAPLITFLDPDNEICPGGYDTLVTLYNENSELDFVSGYNVKVSRELKSVAKQTPKTISMVKNFKQGYFEKGKFPTVATQACVISKDFLNKKNLRFVVNSAGQDTLFGWELLLEANMGGFTGDAFIIYYADREDSITNNVDTSYFKKKLILEESQVEVLKKYDLLDIFKQKHFNNFMNNWYIPKLKMLDKKNIDESLDYLVKICKLYDINLNDYKIDLNDY
ncbi:glycosyltransferase [Francisella salimarina]|uniref:glycosyltransferase n=1 Tax=Francisella salimarina TaxID=2599927 RepID=UPI003752D546